MHTGLKLLFGMTILQAGSYLPNPDWTNATQTAEPTSLEMVWDFTDDPPGSLPSAFSIGTLFDGRQAGEWKVMTFSQALSPPHVLAQLMDKGFEHAYKVVLIERTNMSDGELTVSFFPVSGKADMGGGIIWRAQDDRNYYLLRANPLEQNIRLYRVVKGVREQLANFDQIISIRRWHNLKVIVQHDHFQVFFNENPVWEVQDSTFAQGRIGLWTKADAVTYFDDLRFSILTPHSPSARP